MSDRPPKLPPIALNVVWGSQLLTLGEKVVWYQDWVLDQGREDGAYISHDSMAARLGQSLTAATISRIRQRLKRLTLHEPLRRRDARNLGWVSTLPRQCVPRTHHEAPTLSVALDTYLRTLTTWSEQSGADGPPPVDATVQRERTERSRSQAAVLGGRGEIPSSASALQAQFPSALRKKGVGAHAPRARREDPLTLEEMQAFREGLERDVREGRLRQEQADTLLRVAGLC